MRGEEWERENTTLPSYPPAYLPTCPPVCINQFVSHYLPSLVLTFPFHSTVCVHSDLLVGCFFHDLAASLYPSNNLPNSLHLPHSTKLTLSPYLIRHGSLCTCPGSAPFTLPAVNSPSLPCLVLLTFHFRLLLQRVQSFLPNSP